MSREPGTTERAALGKERRRDRADIERIKQFMDMQKRRGSRETGKESEGGGNSSSHTAEEKT